MLHAVSPLHLPFKLFGIIPKMGEKKRHNFYQQPYGSAQQFFLSLSIKWDGLLGALASV